MLLKARAGAVAILAFLRFPILVQALGPNQYCCQIAKCLWVQKACENDAKCSSNCKLQCRGFGNLNEYGVLNNESRFYACVKQHRPEQNVTNPGLYAEDKRSLDPLDLQCGQSYGTTLDPAPYLKVDWNFCSQNCGGWTLSEAGNQTNGQHRCYSTSSLLSCFR